MGNEYMLDNASRIEEMSDEAIKAKIARLEISLPKIQAKIETMLGTPLQDSEEFDLLDEAECWDSDMLDRCKFELITRSKGYSAAKEFLDPYRIPFPPE